MNTDDNNIEKWLKNYAQKRRANLGQPLDMDSPTREMLLAESRRVWPPGNTAEPEELSYWPRWAFAASCTGVVACALVFVSQPAQHGETAKLDRDSIANGQHADGAMNMAANRKAVTEMPANTLSTPLLVTSAAGAKKDDRSLKSNLGGGFGGGGAAPSAVAPAISPTGPPSSIAPSAEELAIESFRQQFSQVKLEMAKSNLKKGEDVVLRNFEFEQNGLNVRVTDADGSVYSGKLTAAPLLSNVVQEPKRVAQPGKLADATNNSTARNKPLVGDKGLAGAAAQANNGANYQSRGEYQFQVVGTNRSLKERVVFSGQVTADNLQQLDLKSKSTNEAGRGAADKSAALMQYRIRGQAVIGKRNQEIDAQPNLSPRNNQNQ